MSTATCRRHPSLGAQVDELRACVRRAFGDVKVDLVGHSVGGAIAMLLARREPAMIRRIVSIEGNFTLTDAFWSASLGRMSLQQVCAMLEGTTFALPGRGERATLCIELTPDIFPVGHAP